MTPSPHSSHARALLPLIGLQGAVGTLGGFLGFFVIGAHDVHAMFRFTALMLTAAMLATLVAYGLGPRLRISARRLFRLGFLLPGVLLLACEPTVSITALAFGAFVGMTWSARHALEMALFHDDARDRYAAQSGTVTVVCGVGATALATALLAGGALADRIFARELMLWILRMASLLLFWALATLLDPSATLVLGSILLALATACEYLIGKSLLWQRGGAGQPA